MTARDFGDLYQYIARYGRLAEGDIGRSLSTRPHDRIDSALFQDVWDHARASLDARWARWGEEAYELDRPNHPEWIPLGIRHPDVDE